jgi:hypothetical protein
MTDLHSGAGTPSARHTIREMNARERGPLSPITLGLLVLRVTILAILIGSGTNDPPTDDLARFQEIAATEGLPYRDYPVEYAPGEIGIVRLVASPDARTNATRFALMAFLADIATWAAVGFGWGWQAAERYLWLGTSLLAFVYTRFDLVPVALAAWGVALAVRGVQRVGGILAAVAALAKLWPIVVFPAFGVSRRRRALAWAIATLSAMLLAWLAFASSSGIGDVLTFRHATGWGVESALGAVVWIVTGGPVRIEAGAPRVGHVPAFAPLILGGLLVAGLIAVWATAERRDGAALGAASAAAVATLLACSPLFSLQYAAWLLPWGAVAWSEGERWIFRVIAAVEVMTLLLFVIYDPSRVAIAQLAIVCRNALVISIPALWLWPRQRDGESKAKSTALSERPTVEG